ncbi:MAG: 5,10-methylenetetrahydrofolate reductase [Pseudonocardiaceae bacterium]|nr:5,10-methylenetetrahydrofolate reductase [Pseudonocardiaceae bacterium]
MLRNIDKIGFSVSDSERPVNRSDAVRWLLDHPRYEVVPLPGVREHVLDHLETGSTVPVTSAPARGVEPTIAVAETLAADGYNAVPHLAARSVRGEVHCKEILDRLAEAGVREVFVVGGDNPEPAGPYESGEQLLTTIHRLGHSFADIGVPAYPEGHPLLDDETLWRSLQAKQHDATYLVTQMCFDAKAIGRWVAEARTRGVSLPVLVGIPGVVRRRKLARMSVKIGVGQSARFLRKQSSAIWRLLRPGGYQPTSLVRDLARLPVVGADIRSLHLYTFNQVENTATWVRTLAGQR